MTYHRVIPAGMKDDNQVPPIPMFRWPQSPSATNGRSSHARSLSERPTYHAEVSK